jgi:hypothetical protein
MDQAIEAYKPMQIMRLVGWGMQERMRRLVEQYRLDGNVEHLNQAITQPQNRRDKMVEWISEKGVVLLDEYLAILGFVTRSQLNTYVQNMCDYTQDLFDRQQAGTITPDEIATDIETNVNNPADDFEELTFPHSAGYLDLYGK